MPCPRSTWLASALVPCALLATGLAPAPAHAASSGHHAPRFARAHRTGVAAPATTASSVIDVVVPLHVSASAHRGVEALAHSRLSAATRRARVRSLAPTKGQSSLVVHWAQAEGFTVTGTTPWSVSIRGRASSLATAFSTALRTVHHQGKAFVAPRSAPSVPAALRGAADAPVGLDTRPIWSGHAVYGGGDVHVLNSAPVRGAAAGAGKTVATVNLSGWHPSDLAAYRRAAFGTADVAPAITPVPVSGGHRDATVAETDSGDEVEVALDAEAIAGVAPAAAQRMYFGGNTSAGYLAILTQMLTDLTDGNASNDFQTASTSWGACELEVEPSALQSMDAAITDITVAGATFFAASGDDGAFGCSDGSTAVDFPAAAHDTVGVGGTTVTGSAPSYSSQAWTGSGGGCSALITQPARQASTGSSCVGRSVPDIATIADPGTGYWVFDRIDGWMPVGGTSLAAPAAAAGLAGMLSDVTTNHAAAVLPTRFADFFYSHPAAFVDVTSGDNGVYRATSGYDLVTGLGSPQWTALEAALVGAPVTPTGHNEPLLAANASADSSLADLTVQVGQFAFESSFVPNGEPATGFAASATAPTTCGSASAPDQIALPGGQGTVQVALSLATSDPDVAGGCISVSRPLVVDSQIPVVPVPVSTYVGTTSPAYRFSWAAATDSAPSSGVVFYAVFVKDTSTGAEVAQFYTSGRAFPYASSAPFKAVAGHGYIVQVQAIDGAYNIGYRNASFRAPYDDSKATLSKHLSGSTYVSDWTRSKASPDFLGSHVASARKGASFALSFSGKTLTAGVVKSRYGGYADIYVDGVKKARVSLYRSATAYRQALRLATFTTAGSHNVVVKVVGAHQSGSLGNYIFLDSLTVA